MSVSRNHGQSAIELAVLFSVVLIALVALSHYVRYAAGGRVRSAGAAISSSLYSADGTMTDWTSQQATRDTVRANGLVHSEVVDGNATSSRLDVF